MAQPRGTVNGHFRVTEQGEMITQNFGHPGIAVNTLDTYTAGILHYGWVFYTTELDFDLYMKYCIEKYGWVYE